MKKLLNLISILLLAVSTRAAVLTCEFDGTLTSPCINYKLSSVTQKNEPIDVPNAPVTNYVDNKTTQLNLNANNVINIQEFPTQIFQIFINVQSFAAQNLSITELPTDSFNNCQNLVSINIQYSNVGQIQAGFASTCSAVLELVIYKNKILSIDENAFVGLTRLDSITLIGNGLKCIPPKLFRPLIYVDYIQLDSNEITAIHPHQFFNLFRLGFVFLNYNRIQYIPNLFLDKTSTNNSLYIHLRDNPIKAIDPAFMTSLYSGRIQKSPVQIFFQLSSIQMKNCIAPNNSVLTTFVGDLYKIGVNQNWQEQNLIYQTSTPCYSAFTPEMASNNLITCGSPFIPEVIASTTDSYSTSNFFSTLFPTTDSQISTNSGGHGSAAVLTCEFDGTLTSPCINYKLSSVTQKNEPIDVPNAPYPNYVDNKTAYLILNTSTAINIQEFPINIFKTFINVKSFAAQNFSMTELPTDSFYNCKNLTSINIQYSNVEHIQAGFASTCSAVSYLAMGHSKILSIDENAFVGLTSLYTLNIAFSDLKCIPPKLFHPLININYIQMNINQITAIHPYQFFNLFHLKFIDLRSNQIQYIPNLVLDENVNNETLKINLHDNPIKAIDPVFMTSFYSARMNQFPVEISFQPSSIHIKTCIASNNSVLTTFNGSLYQIGVNQNWQEQNFVYQTSTPCYSAFTPEMASNSLITCGSPFIPADNLSSTSTWTSSSFISTLLSTTNSQISTDSGGYGSPSSIQGSGSSTDSYSASNFISTLFPTTEYQSGTSNWPSSSTGIETTPTRAGGQCATDKVCRYYLDWNNQYTCVIDGVDETLTSIAGAHYLTYSDHDLTRLYFTNSRLSLVPEIILKKFPNLKFLHISNCGMTIINARTFKECGNLEFLDASDNEISHVDDTAFVNCAKLKIIDLTGNPLDYVSQSLFQLDPTLKRIHLKRLDDWTLA